MDALKHLSSFKNDGHFRDVRLKGNRKDKEQWNKV